MKTFARDFLTGLTALGGLFLLAFLLMRFGETKNVTTRFHTFTLRTHSVRGLSPVAPVTMNGVAIGNVIGLVNRPDPREGVDILIKFNAKIPLRREFRPVIDQGLIGDSVLELAVAPDLPPPDERSLVRDGDLIEREVASTFDELFGRVSGPLSSLQGTADRINTLADTYTRVGQDLQGLVAPRSPEQVDAGEEPTLRSAVARLDTALAGLNRWAGDETLREEARSLLIDARRAVSRGEESLSRFDGTLDAVQAQVNASGEEVRVVAEDLRAALRSTTAASDAVREAFAAAARGSGTVGLLLNNPDLYLSLEDAAQRLEMTLREAQLLIEKFRSEGVPIQF